MPDSSTIRKALVGKLLGDATLVALAPDGVYLDAAADGARRFVIVSLAEGDDEDVFGGRAFEDRLYLVKAVVLGSSGTDADAAAARIDALLADQTLTATGYTCMAVYRERALELTEVDPEDTAIRWQHRGGYYRVQMAVA